MPDDTTIEPGPEPIAAHATYDAVQLIMTARSEHRSQQTA